MATQQQIRDVLERHRLTPSPQRVAVAEYVLATEEHPSADEVLARVRQRFPMISRATVYNTLHAMVERRLLKELALADGKTVYDPCMAPHHHFIDEETGAIRDLPWAALHVTGVDRLSGIDVREYEVVVRGRRRRRR